MDKELFSNIFWIIILIVFGFCLAILSRIWFGSSDFLSKLLDYFTMFTDIFSEIIFNPIGIIFIIMIVIIILFLLSLRNFLK